jgi:predicted nucleic acid-binding protein
MLLVVDANIVFSVLISGGRTLDIFLLNRWHKRFDFIAPEYLMVEIENHTGEITEKTKLSNTELRKVLGFIEREMEFIPFEEFKDMYREAEKITPDPYDTPYFALALKLKGTIWSNDKALKSQSTVRVITTKEVLTLLQK